MFAPNKEYTVYYKDVRGLSPSNPIMYRGVQVGLVKDVSFVGKNLDSVKVTVQIDHEQFLMKMNTQATLGSDGLLGGMKIELVYKDTSLDLMAQGGVLIPATQKDLTQEVSDQVLPLKLKAESLIATIDTVVTSINTFWNGSASTDFEQSLGSVRRALFQFERTAVRIDTLVASEKTRLSRIFKSVECFTDNLCKNNDNITNTLTNVTSFSEELKKVELEKTLRQAEETFTKLNLIVGQINNGEGTIGNLIYNDSLHTAILETNATLQLLVNDFRNYPNRYFHFSIFGSREKTPRLNSKEEKELKELLDLQKSGKLRRFTNEEMDSLRNKVFGP